MGIFGWSMPPGCSGVPGDDDYPCEICGLDPNKCECPECPECGTIGDVRCYTEYNHMPLTQEIKDSIERVAKEWEEHYRLEAEAEAKERERAKQYEW